MCLRKILRFVYDFSRDVFDVKRKHLKSRKCIFQFFFYGFCARIIFLSQNAAFFHGKRLVLNKTHPSEHDDALDVQRPFARLFKSFVIYAERYFVVLFNRVNFVSFFCAVEVDYAFFLIVIEIHRNSVWIIIVAKKRKNAARFFPEQFLTVFVCKLLFKSSHLSEHTPILTEFFEKDIVSLHKKRLFLRNVCIKLCFGIRSKIITMKKKSVLLDALKAAFPFTIPIFAGFWFLSFAYGIYMNVSGFSFVYPMCMSAIIFGGSLEFVAVSMLLSPFAPVQSFIMALLIQARHLFYGISMLDKYKSMGIKKTFLIFGMCDETFSINYTAKIPNGIDRGWFYFFVTLLDYLYWVSGATLGGILGSLITFNTKGLDFVMTAMFVVIFMEQWLKEKSHWTALIGLVCSALCLFFFGSGRFMIPSMIAILALLSIFRKPLEADFDMEA